jgi:hypothetical protein
MPKAWIILYGIWQNSKKELLAFLYDEAIAKK